MEMKGSVRVDFVGGTIDLSPINVILPKVMTLNAACSLQAAVKIDKEAVTKQNTWTIISRDYKKTWDISCSLQHITHAGEMEFVARILRFFKLPACSIELSSGTPPGSGLGGSSAMGVTLAKACLAETGVLWNTLTLEQKVYWIEVIRNIEASILDRGPAGYQDYYPAAFGGMLALKSHFAGVEVEQIFEEKFVRNIENHVALFYSGKQRDSGINNWEVYKNFFDRQEKVRSGLNQIAELAVQAYEACRQGDHHSFLEKTWQDGEAREKLFPGIVPEELQAFFNDCRQKDLFSGAKMCGAGGGGCFMMNVQDAKHRQALEKVGERHGIKPMEFSIMAPL
jgi:D-glycero-alpha-D-manno-heptose-7-phosphate kinase